MSKTPVIVLSILLAAAIVFSIVFYGQREKSKAALVVSEKKLASLDKQISQLNEEKDALHEQIQKVEAKLTASTQAEKRIGELENDLTKKDRSLAELEDKVLVLVGESQEKEKTMQDLRAEALAKNRLVTELRDQLKKGTSRVASLEEQIAKAEAQKVAEVERLEAELDGAKSQAALLEKKIADVQAEGNAQVTRLEAELDGARSQVAQLEKKTADVEAEKNAQVTRLKTELDGARSEIGSLKQDVVDCRQAASSLEQRLSDLKGQRVQLERQLGEVKSTYDAMVKDLKNQIQNKEVTISALEEKLSITFVDRILFEFGKATISPQGEEILAKVGGILKNVSAKRVRIIGHTDNKPIHPDYRYRFPSNWELSAARAAAVVRYFQNEVGLDPENLEAVGHSFYDSVASNETEEGRAQNRRVNIIVAPKLE